MIKTNKKIIKVKTNKIEDMINIFNWRHNNNNNNNSNNNSNNDNNHKNNDDSECQN